MDSPPDSERPPPDSSAPFDALVNYLSHAGAASPKRAAGALLREFGSVGRVLTASSSRLSRLVGRRTAALIRASRKLVQSSLLEQMKQGPVLASSDEVIRYLQLRLGFLRHERVLAIYLDADWRLLRVARIADGSVGGASPEIQTIVRIALDVGATAFFVVHNHPSGNPEASRSDLLWTRRLADVSRDLGLLLVDHFIVAGGAWRSVMTEQSGLSD